jgi:hypothetical protein
MIGGLEGCGPSQPWPAVNQHHSTERTPSRESAGNGPSGRGNDDRWGPEGLRSLAAVAGRKLASLHGADGADALQGIGSAMAHPVVATMIGGGLEGLRSLAAVAGRKSTPFHGADGADALQGIGSAMAHPVVATMIGGGLEGLRSLAAVAGRKLASFHGADGADALQLQGIGRQWPIRSWQR